MNDTQKTGLKYYEDILKRIPRNEIYDYNEYFNKVVTLINSQSKNKLFFEIVGSFRRGAQSSGDIDVILTSEESNNFEKFINILLKEKIIVEILSKGASKCLVISKIKSSDAFRRVDFLFTSSEEYPFSILYFTGSKMFNTVMRHKALEMGFTMNEHGIYKIENKKKGNKVDIIFKTEKDIFDFLKLEYKTPIERIDGRSVINKKHEEKIKSKILVIEDDTNSQEEKYVLNKNIQSIVTDFKKNGLSVLKKLNENQLLELLNESNKAYYNQQPFMTDNEFDIIKEYFDNNYNKGKQKISVGASVERNKVNLPYFMGSMDKIKPDTNVLTSWIQKFNGSYILSCKLDGVSGLYSTEGEMPKLYTRGDGKIGQDVSYLIPYLSLPKTKGIVIRGEFIIKKDLFEKKYKNKFANSRNFVAGLINQKTINDSITDVEFVSYEVIKPILKPSDQMNFLKINGLKTVLNTAEKIITNNSLSTILIEWRKNYIYEIDGIIVTNDKIYQRKEGNPEYAFAFKMVLSDQVAEAKVVDVIWTPSKDGYLKPRVQIEPINLCGVCIEYATGFNASFINENKIGVGSLIEIIRSGDVIPYIRKVVVPAQEPKMPNLLYKWNDTNIDIMLENIDSDETVREKNITGFFRGIGVEGLSSGNVSRIIKKGYDTIPKIIKMTVDNFLEIDGFQIKTATKLYRGIKEKLISSPILTIMAASNIFGRGFSDKKIELIMDIYPDILLTKESESLKIEKISSIKGMATKSAEAFVNKIPDFINFMKELNIVSKLNNISQEKKEINQSHPLFGKTIVMTGFRDNNIQEKIKEFGAKLGSSVSKNTSFVLVKNIDEDSGKISEAKKLGIPIVTKDDFNKKFL